MIFTGTQSDVWTLARLPQGEQEAVLRTLPRPVVYRIIAEAQRIQAGGGGRLAGLGFLPSIAALLFGAAKVVGTVATTAVATGITNALTPAPKSPTVVYQPAPAPAAPASSPMTPWLLVGGLAVVAVLLAPRRRGR